VSQGVAAGEGIKFAGLLVDSFSSDGVFTDPPGFLKAAVDVTRTALRLGRSFFRRRFPWRLSCLGSAPWRVAFVSMEAIPSPRNGRRVHPFGMHRFRSDIGNITLGQVTESIQC